MARVSQQLDKCLLNMTHDEGTARDEATERLLFAEHARKQENGHAHDEHGIHLDAGLDEQKERQQGCSQGDPRGGCHIGGKCGYSLSSVAE